MKGHGEMPYNATFHQCVTLCPFLVLQSSRLQKRAGCFALFVFLVSRGCFVAFPHDATGLSAVCDCGIS